MISYGICAHFYHKKRFWASGPARLAMPSLYDLVKTVPRIYDGDIRTLDYEWTNLDSTPLPPELRDDKCGIVEFYVKVGQTTDNEGSHQFKLFSHI